MLIDLLRRYLRPYRRQLAWVVLLQAAQTVAGLWLPRLNSDIIDKGMVMSGGGSMLRNIDRLLTQVTGVPCHVAENPLNCVATGTGLALEHFDFFKKSLVQAS